MNTAIIELPHTNARGLVQRHHRVGLAFVTPADADTEEPISGTGRCYACDDCRGYVASKKTNWCTCGHHWERHQ